MSHKINRSKHDVSLKKVHVLKRKIQNPEYLNNAIRWIANHLAQNIRS